MIAARSQALQSYDQTHVAELSIRDQYNAQLAAFTTARVINAQNDRTAVQTTQLQTTAEQAIAAAEARAQMTLGQYAEEAAQAQASAYQAVGITQANDYSSAAEAEAHAQQQGSIWSTIGSVFTSIFPFL